MKPNAQGNGGVICYNTNDDNLAAVKTAGYFGIDRRVVDGTVDYTNAAIAAADARRLEARKQQVASVIDFVDRCAGDGDSVRVEIVASDGQEVIGLHKVTAARIGTLTARVGNYLMT